MTIRTIPTPRLPLPEPLPPKILAIDVFDLPAGLPNYLEPGRLINGTSGADVILPGAAGTGSGPDTVYGLGGDDLIIAGWGADYIEGGIGADTIYGDQGRDTIYGGAGRDSLYGGSSDDFISGGTEGDQLTGDAGRDTLWGGAGDDTIFGGDDADTIYIGGAGNDAFFDWSISSDQNLGILAGDAGYDTLVLRDGTPLSSITFDDDYYDSHKNTGRLTWGEGDDAREVRLSSVEWVKVDGVFHAIGEFLI
jgi:Ca2+-binding RTX toxin-like protein